MKTRPDTLLNARYSLLWRISLLMLLMLTTGAGQAAVHSRIDRSTVYKGDTFTLTIEADRQSSGVQPDLSPLNRDFEILGNSTSTQISIINGRRSDKTLWQLQLQPRRTGRLRIPPITVGHEQTAPLELTVSEAPQQIATQSGEHVFIEAEVHGTGKPAYVQQQIPYTVRLYYDGSLQEGELNAPELKDAVIEQLGEDKRYTTVRNGRQYHVIERDYVISPEKSGTLHIPPATFHGRIAVAGQGGNPGGADDLMQRFFSNSPFANDPFFRNSPLNHSLFSGGIFGSPGKAITVGSRGIDMDIKPRPATTASDWLPAESVTLHDSWTDQPPEFRAGEPVSRTITIRTRGLAGSQIPELNITAPANTRLYPEGTKQESHTDGSTLYGTSTQTLTYIPGKAGELDIPAITLDWWDTRHNKAAHTTLPGWQFRVLPGAADNTPEPAVVTPPRKAQSANKRQPPATPPVATTGTGRKPDWRWITAGGGLVFAVIALAVIMLRRARRREQDMAPAMEEQPPKTVHRKLPGRKSALQALQKACENNDRHAAARALITLGETYWPDQPPRSLDALAARVEHGQAQLRALDRSLYAADGADWNGAALWAEFKQGFKVKPADKQQGDDGLSPLYPQRY